MTTTNFPRIMRCELAYEGGYSNHPKDTGGVTLQGVIQRVYDGYRRRKGKPQRALTRAMLGTPEWEAERDDIYREQYWNAVRGDELPAGVDLVVMDGAVNSGPYQSGKWLQRALGEHYTGPLDGHIGEGTLAALAAHPDHDALIADMLARRLGMLRALRTWPDFGEGWGARVASARTIGQAWAMGSVGPAPVEAHVEGGNAKGYASDVAQPPLDQSAGTQVAGGGTVIAASVQTAQQTLEPLVGSSHLVANIYIALTIVGVVIASSGVLYALWAGRKARQAQRAIDGDVLAELPGAAVQSA